MAGDWFDSGGSGTAIDVTEVLNAADGPTKAIAAIVEAGALLSLGTTSDGGALGVTVTVDGRWRREYFRNADELLAWLAEALPAVEAARPSDRPSAGNGQRQRRRSTR